MAIQRRERVQRLEHQKDGVQELSFQKGVKLWNQSVLSAQHPSFILWKHSPFSGEFFLPLFHSSEIDSRWDCQ